VSGGALLSAPSGVGYYPSVPDLQRIDRYELRGLLGRGAMGRVYRAWDSKLDREVALKVVSQGADQKNRERFHREVIAIASLRHPNIVEVYDYSGPDSEQLYYVMEKLDGEDLFNMLQSHGPMPEPATVAVGHELCLALAIMHDAGIIHRDLKPENVFLTGQGRVVLTDFGVVKALRQDSPVSGYERKTDVVGTPGFMAPELLASKQLGPFTDIFALGALLYNIITGELPYSGANAVDLHRNMQTADIPDLRNFDPRASEAFDLCLKRCLAAKPKDRPQTADELRRELRVVLDPYAIPDLRDELAGYLRDPSAYAVSAKQRGTRRLIRELATAVAERDRARIDRLEERLGQVDPQGLETKAMAEVLEAAAEQAEAGRPTGGRRLLWLALAAAVVVAAAGAWVASATGRVHLPFGHKAVVVGRPPDLPPPAAPAKPGPAAPAASGAAAGAAPAPAPPAATDATKPDTTVAPASTGLLEIRILGRASAVTVGGERLSAQELRSGKRLPPGRYRVEVAGGRRRMVLDVDVAGGRRVVVTADVKRGNLKAE
jgi:hypothetical protein